MELWLIHRARINLTSFSRIFPLHISLFPGRLVPQLSGATYGSDGSELEKKIGKKKKKVTKRHHFQIRYARRLSPRACDEYW